MADDKEAVILASLACTSLVFCALDLHQSQEQLLENVRWTCPTHAEASKGTPATQNASRKSSGE